MIDGFNARGREENRTPPDGGMVVEVGRDERGEENFLIPGRSTHRTSPGRCLLGFVL